MKGNRMSQPLSSKPTQTTLKQALKLQKEAQRLIVGGYAGATPASKAGRSVIAWAATRQRFVESEPASLADGQILLHFAMQALTNAVESGATEEAHALATEASIAIASLGTFLAKSTGKAPRDFGLFSNYFPEPLH
jgi:hypothetical protein